MNVGLQSDRQTDRQFFFFSSVEINVGIRRTDRQTDRQFFSSTRHSHGACGEREIDRESHANFLMGVIIDYKPIGPAAQESVNSRLLFFCTAPS